MYGRTFHYNPSPTPSTDQNIFIKYSSVLNSHALVPIFVSKRLVSQRKEVKFRIIIIFR
jgi:hypothetical protein